MLSRLISTRSASSDAITIGAAELTRMAIGEKVDGQNAASRCLVAGGAKAAAEAGREVRR